MIPYSAVQSLDANPFSYSVLGNDNPHPQTVQEEEYFYEPAAPKRKLKVPPPSPRRSEL